MIKTTINEIGKDSDFKDYPIIVLFNSDCPDELKDICILHQFADVPKAEVLKVGGKIIFNSKEYEIEFVGDSANQNFQQLGHITINFNPDLEKMPGSILVSPYAVPKLEKGDIITFE